MKRNLTLDEETLAAYLRGDVDAETAAAVEAWYAASEANRRKLGEIYYILFLNDRVNDAHRIDTEAALRSVRNRIGRCARRSSAPTGSAGRSACGCAASSCAPAPRPRRSPCS